MDLLSALDVAALLRRDPPTPEQQAVIEAPLEPALVVAGAGSGKTETMAARVVWLLANGLVGPEQVLGLTFTRKAAAELELRIRLRVRRLVAASGQAGVRLPGRDRLLAGAAGDELLADLARPTVATYNSYAASLVADHALRLGVEPASRLLGEAAQYQLAAQVVDTWPGDLDVDFATSTLVEAVLALAGALSEHLLTTREAAERIEQLAAELAATPTTGPKGHLKPVSDVLRSLAARRRLIDLVEAYTERKRAGDALDFGDQVALAARLAREVPQVAAGERDRFAVVLLDEYQDTSFAQVQLLAALFGDGHPVTAVGDPHQSIYGWRGASAGGLARFAGTFATPGPTGSRPARQHHLSTSWRNDHAILAVANRTAAPLRASSPIEVRELVAGPRAAAGSVQARVLLDVGAQAEAVADFVVAGRAQDPQATAAVLCRRRAQFDVLADALRRRGLRVEVVGLGGLLTSPEVVDLVAALQVVDDPGRGDALMRLLTGARTRLGAADLHALADWSRELAGPPVRTGPADGAVVDRVDGVSIVDALDQLPRPGWRSRRGRRFTDVGRSRLVDLAGVLAALRSRSHLWLPDLVADAERLLGLDIEVASRPGADAAGPRVHLDAFADVVAEFAGSVEQPSLTAFLAWLAAAEQRERGLELPVTEPDPTAVQICTVHAAKGLEWDLVAVPGLVDGWFPATAALGPNGPTDKGWLTALDTLPYPLRGDRDDLPLLDTRGAATSQELAARLAQLARDTGEHQVAEERRLAYVAFTRARHHLLLTAARWDTATKPRALSPFLSELVDEGLVDVAEWVDLPVGDNPYTAHAPSAVWPGDPFDPGDVRPDADGKAPVERGPSQERRAVEAAAAAVRRAAGGDGAPDDSRAGPDVGLVGSDDGSPGPGESLVGRDCGLVGRDGGVVSPGDGVDDELLGPDDELAELLLAEERARREPVRWTELPPHLSASAMVRLEADPTAFALDLRRPVPARPSSAARRGTSFHAWVEQFFQRASLVEVEELPGADDDEPGAADQAQLRAGFEASGWADRAPIAVEVDLETTVAGYTLRARVDAVFADPARPGGQVVVDWKTGAPPSDQAAAAARELQLAVYRLAWSRRTGLPLDQVRAAFCYVSTGRTVYPQRLLDEPAIAALLARVTS